MLGAVSVLAALVGRERAGTAAGGQRIDVSLLGSTLASLVNQAQNAFVSGDAPGRRGNAHPNIVPYETFATADGEIAVAVGSERQWPRFCEALGLASPGDDARFATNGDRVEHRAELRPLLADRLAQSARARTGWRRSRPPEIPAGPDPRHRRGVRLARGGRARHDVEMEHPAWGVIRQVGVPFELSGTPATIRTPPPLLGEGTDDILGELGYARGDRGDASGRHRVTGLRQSSARRNERAATVSATAMRTSVESTGVRTSAGSTGEPVASETAGPSSPPGRNRPRFGIADAIDRTSQRDEAEPRRRRQGARHGAAEEREGRPGRSAPARPGSRGATQPPIGMGSNRIAV